ncbi:MAG: oxidoreductase domain-containing protein [Osedax symbiont Rs2]|nr:MAG: oxidoreductase domain-containing protein [Osedax symbiont Rs2]
MNQRSVRYGILGCGMMGLEHLQNLALIDGAEVVAIAEPDLDMRKRASQLAPRAEMYDDLDALLAGPELDAIVIVTPNYQHAEQLLQILRRTKLAVLVEKPLVTTLEQVKTIKEAVAKHPAPVWVAMEYRYMPPITELRSRLQQQQIGPLKMLTIREHRLPFLSKVGNWNRFNRNTGGTLVEKCCHFFDLMRLLSNDEVVRVYASAGQNANHLHETYNGEAPDIIDNAYVILDFASGLRAMLELNMFAEGSRYQEEISAVGLSGKLECFVPGPGRFWPTATLGAAPQAKIVYSPRDPKGPIESIIGVDPALLQAGDHNGSTYYQHLGFFNAITQQGEVEVSVDDGLKAVVIGLAAQHSATTGSAVTLSADGLSF